MMGAALFAFVCVLSVAYFILSANQRANQKYQDQLDQPEPFEEFYQKALDHVS